MHFPVFDAPRLLRFATARYTDQLRQAAEAAGVRVELIELAALEDVSPALAGLAQNRPAALVVMPGPMLFFLARELPRRAQVLNLPAIYPFEESAEAGGLMSYAAPITGNYRRAAHYVDRILRGAKPAELPIEQPTRLELVINMATARSQRIHIPRDIVLRADRVIQ